MSDLVPEGCESCFEKQVTILQAARGHAVDLCPILALLALNAEHITPPIERHFLKLADECNTETHGFGGLYKVQNIQGERAVKALVKIQELILSNEETELVA